MIEMIEAVALAVEHADHFVAHHKRNRQLRACGLRGTDVARVLGDVRRVDRALLQNRCAGDAVVMAETNFVFAGVPADLRADAEAARHPCRAEGWPRWADENSRGQSPGCAATPRPGQRWKARPGRLHKGPRVSACWEKCTCGDGVTEVPKVTSRLKPLTFFWL